MEIHDIHKLVLDEIYKMDGEKKMGADYIMVCCPFHGDTAPSLGIYTALGMEIPLGSFHCFAAETKVVSNKGTKKIAELFGMNGVQVIDGNGQWVDTVVDAYGVQQLYKLTLSRNGKTKEIFTTRDHRWLVKGKKDTVSTVDLKAGQYLEAARLQMDNSKIRLDVEGIKHGFVFGDGTLQKSYGKLRKDGTRRPPKHSYAVAMFQSRAKMEMTKYFKDAEYWFENERGKRAFYKGYEYWKRLPRLEETLEYKLGFIAGYFAADGCVAKEQGGTVSLSCVNKRTLTRMRRLMLQVGITTFSVGHQMRKGYLDHEAPMYHMNILKTTIPKSMLLLKHHRQNFAAKNITHEYLRWRVVSVEKTDRKEEVYCAHVPTTNSFMLEDNILTGNCFGCGVKGMWNKLAKQAGVQQIEEWKIKDAGELSVGNLTKRFDQQKVYSSVPKLMRDLDRMAYIPWPESEPWRGYNGKIVHDFGGLLLMNNFNAAYPVCFFPVMLSKERIVGGVAAYLKKQMNGLSYVNTKGEWTLDSGLFQMSVARKLIFEHDLDYICIVEGPRDVLATTCEGMPTVGALGANNFNTVKMQKIKNLGVNTIYSIADNDSGGDKLRVNIKRACVDVGIRHVPIRLPKEYDENGKLIKLDPDCLDKELWSDIKSFIKENHDTVRVRKEYGWKRAG